MKTRLLILAAAASLSACASGSFNVEQSELANARAAIAAAKAANAETCAPKTLAEAEAALYFAAHELDETGQHPDETAGLIARAESKAQDAKREAAANCAPKPKAKPLPVAPEIISLSGVHFETNSDALTADSVAILDKAVETLNKRSDIRVEVAAHTDSRGKDSYNLSLSERRAQSVFKYLADHGVDTARLSAHGYGEAQPIASNDTAQGRATNRRVELRVAK